jgi:hypothetical protein
MLARHIGGRLLEAIQERLGARPERLMIEVDENFGQWAGVEWQP